MRPQRVAVAERLAVQYIVAVQDDDVPTGDLAPDGAGVMAYRSNVPAIVQFTL